MNKQYSASQKIMVYGSQKEIDKAFDVLNGISNILSLDERELRIHIQDQIDKYDVKADILVNGNTVWSLKRVLKDIKRVQKNGMDSMTDYLYKYFTLACGSIAHYSKNGWIDVYPTFEHLKAFFKQDEFGFDVITASTHGRTFSDKERIAKEINKVFKLGLRD